MNRAPLAWFLGGIVALLAGMALHGAPTDPDVEFTRWQVLGVLLVVAAFSKATIGWGTYVCHKLAVSRESRWMMILATGTLMSSSVAFALGVLGLAAYDFSVLAVLWIGGGLWLGGRAAKPLFPALKGWGWAPPGLFACGLALWIASASLANGGTDPPYYHLLGPRIWSDLGAIRFRPWYPATPLASHWEYLFIWGNLLLGAQGGKGLISGQLFGQLVHVALGVTLASAAVYAITARLTGKSLWAWLAVLICMCSEPLDVIAFLAKNDYGVTGWSLTGIALLFSPGLALPKSRRRELALAGLFIGVAIMSKMVLAICLGAALFVWSCERVFLKREPVQLVWVATAVFLAMLPTLLRNLILVGNPVYPFFARAFGAPNAWISSSTLLFTGREIGGSSRPIWQALGAFWIEQKHVAFLGPVSLLFPLAAWTRKSLRPGVPYFLVAQLSMLILVAWGFGDPKLRWVAPALLLHASLAIVVWAEGAEWLAKKLRRPRLRGIAFALPAVVIFGSVGFDWSPWGENTWRNAFFGNSPTLKIRHPTVQNGGDALAWLRFNLKPGDRVVTTGFQMLYYVSHLEVAAIPSHPAIDEATFGSQDPRRVVRALREFGVKYLLDIKHFNTRYYAGSFGEMFDLLAMAHPQTIAYISRDTFVVDLESLNQELSGACAADDSSREWDWPV